MSERNKYITEAMGECWHDYFWQDAYPECFYECILCSDQVFGQTMNPSNNSNLNFSTPEGFFKLWNWAIEQEWWWKFRNSILTGDAFDYQNIEHIINPDNLANAIEKYLKER